MASEFGSVWSWNGKVTRGMYALAGAIGFAIKHNLDRYIGLRFGFRWGVWSYLDPLSRALQASPLTVTEKKFLAILLLTAIPFIWIGIAMTLKRLRDAGQPLWLTLLFFAPIVNLFFFALLSVLPSKEVEAGRVSIGASLYWPRSRGSSAALAALVAGLLGVLTTYGDLRFLGSYGLTLFIALPFVMGYLAVWLYSRTQDIYVNKTDLLAVVTLSVLIAGAGILAIAIEGAICILMAAPIAWFLAMLGGALGAVIHGGLCSRAASPSALAAMVVALPMLLGAEHVSPPPVPRFQVRTSIRNCRATGSRVEAADPISGAAYAGRVALPPRRCLSDRGTDHRRRSDRGPRMPLFHGQLQGADSCLGARQAFCFRGFR